MFRILQLDHVVVRVNNLALMLDFYQQGLGRVDVSGLFLQQSGRFLCKAARVQCSYST